MSEELDIKQKKFASDRICCCLNGSVINRAQKILPPHNPPLLRETGGFMLSGGYYSDFTPSIKDDMMGVTRSQITNHQSPITNHQSPITNHQREKVAQKRPSPPQPPSPNMYEGD